MTDHHKFRIPRKLKKRLSKPFWLYPKDENNCFKYASPSRNEEDFVAYKKGIVTNHFRSHRSKVTRMEYGKKMNAVIEVTHQELKTMVGDVFDPLYRVSSYNALTDAKKYPSTIIAYYNFINAYNMEKNDEYSSYNTCCLSVDYAKKLLKARKKRK